MVRQTVIRPYCHQFVTCSPSGKLTTLVVGKPLIPCREQFDEPIYTNKVTSQYIQILQNRNDESRESGICT